MDDRMGVLNVIKSAERATPTCECGAVMAAVMRDGRLWLDCSARPQQKAGRLAWAVAFVIERPHTRRLLLDQDELGLAA